MSVEKPAIILYSHPMCPSTYPTQALLNRAKANYVYINIREDDDARERVRAINNGDESVPTLVFPDGSTLTEPWPAAVQAKLRQFGYGSRWQSVTAFFNSPRLVMG